VDGGAEPRRFNAAELRQHRFVQEHLHTFPVAKQPVLDAPGHSPLPRSLRDLLREDFAHRLPQDPFACQRAGALLGRQAERKLYQRTIKKRVAHFDQLR
jgi:hypothetical protein